MTGTEITKVAIVEDQREIREGLGRLISTTIKFHLRHIYDKLQVHTKSEAVAKALKHGLTR